MILCSLAGPSASTLALSYPRPRTASKTDAAVTHTLTICECSGPHRNPHSMCKLPQPATVNNKIPALSTPQCGPEHCEPCILEIVVGALSLRKPEFLYANVARVLHIHKHNCWVLVKSRNADTRCSRTAGRWRSKLVLSLTVIS